MQWSVTENGGFSEAEELWLPSVDPKVYMNDNMERQAEDPNSPYRFMSEILKRRQEDPALREGDIREIHTDNPDVLAFARNDPENPRRQVISVTNFTQNTVSVSVLDARHTKGRITSTSLGRPSNDEVDLGNITLPPDASYLIDSV